jgi:signal transduction histidine kinase
VRRPGNAPSLPLAIGAGLFVALVALAFLQFRWIAELSNAERDRLRANISDGASRFVDDFDRELDRAARVLQPGAAVVAPEADRPGLSAGRLGGDLADRLARWRSTAPEPALVQELLVVSRRGPGELELRRLDETTGTLVSAAWGEDLESVRRVLGARERVPRQDALLPGLVLPVRERRPERDGPPEESSERRPPREHVVVRLDLAWLRESYLPRLAERRFGESGALAFGVTVVVAADPRTVVFQAGPAVADGVAVGPGDLVRGLFHLRPFPELTSPEEGGRLPRRPQRPPPRDAPPPGQDPGSPSGPEGGLWRLEVRHPAGSLEAAVSGLRRRNLGLSLAALLLLGTSAAFLVDSTRRAQRLARQQLDFVAAVSHELRTPLTAMRSAGQNLADGIVDDPERIRKYGALIEREGRRLTEMVGRVLAFAGIRSGQQALRMQPVPVGALVESVLADLRWVHEEKRVHVEVEIADGLPEVRGDELALRQALANLLDNAAKYGGPARWIGVRAHEAATPRGREVVLAVSDRGIGIPRRDLPHLFEPFFRGREAPVAGIPGSGLGLAVVRGLVEAQGGRVTVESLPGRGTTFAVRLPAATGADAAETKA